MFYRLPPPAAAIQNIAFHYTGNGASSHPGVQLRAHYELTSINLLIVSVVINIYIYLTF